MDASVIPTDLRLYYRRKYVGSTDAYGNLALAMKNPFVFARPLGNEPQILRSEESAQLLRRFEDGVNTRLASPRDYGKTSLLRQVCTTLVQEGTPAVLVDLYGITNSVELVRRIESAYDGLPQRKWSRVVKGLKIRGGGGGLNTPVGGLSADFGQGVDADAALLAALDLPLHLAQKTGNRVLVCFDEFQEILRADLDGTMRSVIQHHGDLVTYVFSGSHVGMMDELFSSRSRPFFNQAAPLRIGRFSDTALVEFVTARFDETGKEIDEILDPYLEAVRGHPQRAMLLAHLIWGELPLGGKADAEVFDRALEAAWPYLENEFEAIWSRLTRVEAAVMNALAAGVTSLRGKDAQRQFGLASGPAGPAAAGRLAGQGVLLRGRDGTGYQIDDPFFARWVRNGRLWSQRGGRP